MKNTVKVASIYVSTIIGAGFASGQEIIQFFSRYRQGGFLGILLAGILFSAIGATVLDKVYCQRIRNYDELLIPAVGKPIGRIIEIAVAVFALAVFSIMIAGAGSIFTDKLGIPFKLGVALMTLICMVALLTDIKGIITLSTIIAPVLIFGIIAVGMIIILFREVPVFSPAILADRATNNWLFSSLLYVGYNSIIAIVVMSNLLPHLKTRRVAVAGGVLGGLMLCIVALVLNVVLFMYQPEVMAKELPILDITHRYSAIAYNLYAVILWLAMFVSAVTSGYGFIDRVCSKVRVNRKLVTLIVCAVVMNLSGFGFSRLIAILYPIFGYIGLFIAVVMLVEAVAGAYSISIKNYKHM